MRVLTITFATVLVVWAHPSGAAETSTPTSGDDLAKQARRSYVVGNLEEAIKGFENAYQLSGDPSLLFDLAEAQREAGHSSDALTSYQNYLRRAPAGIYRKSAERQIRELKKARPQAVGLRIAPASVTAPKAAAAAPSPAKAPSGANSSIAPPLPVPPVAATATSVPVPADAPVPPGSTSVPAPTISSPRIDPVWQPDAPPPPRPLLPLPAPSAIVRPLPSSVAHPLASFPPGHVDPPAGLTSPSAPPPPQQAQVDLITAPKGDPAPEGVTVARWVPIALGVLTVALGAAAVVAGLSASHRYDDLQSGCGATPAGCSQPDIDNLQSRVHRANFLWVATGVAAAGFGTTLYLNLRDGDPAGQSSGL